MPTVLFELEASAPCPRRVGISICGRGCGEAPFLGCWGPHSRRGGAPSVVALRSLGWSACAPDGRPALSPPWGVGLAPQRWFAFCGSTAVPGVFRGAPEGGPRLAPEVTFVPLAKFEFGRLVASMAQYLCIAYSMEELC